MPIIVMNTKTPPQCQKDDIIAKAIENLGISKRRVVSSDIHKTSLDARKRTRKSGEILLISSVILYLDSEQLERRLSRIEGVKFFEETHLNPEISTVRSDGRVVVAGFGPAGMFSALVLSEYGYKPIVLERGGSVDERILKTTAFWGKGELDEESNVQFGEGGAGTFSDGKLLTRINDPLCRYVLRRFVEFGAPESILSSARPHIGTDLLTGIVKNIRERIIENGGEVRFHSKLTGLDISYDRLSRVYNCNENGSDLIPTSALILSIGHSARDTFDMLLNSGINICAKPFSVGARIEHTQKSVDESLYGDLAGSDFLPAGEYNLSHRRIDGRACYTFCMCPGGSVIAAASEKNTVVTNGMSLNARDGQNANSAVAVSVSPADFGSGALDGVRFAESIERLAYKMTGSYSAPAMTVGAFIDGSNCNRSVVPSYKPSVCEADLNKLFPKFVSDMMKEGLNKFSNEMDCFSDMGAVLTAPETRTSSPVRIMREDDMSAVGIKNLIPCGEGAGYAGGITSSAVDGIKAALKVMSMFAPPD